MTNINWDKVQAGVDRERNKMIWRPYGAPQILNLENSALHDAPISVPWSIPEKLVVSVAITGAFFRHDQNPNQPITPEEIRNSAMQVLDAGASTVHIHVRDDPWELMDARRNFLGCRIARREHVAMQVGSLSAEHCAWESLVERTLSVARLQNLSTPVPYRVWEWGSESRWIHPARSENTSARK